MSSSPLDYEATRKMIQSSSGCATMATDGSAAAAQTAAAAAAAAAETAAAAAETAETAAETAAAAAETAAAEVEEGQAVGSVLAVPPVHVSGCFV
jgi:hypothetical protein